MTFCFWTWAIVALAKYCLLSFSKGYYYVDPKGKEGRLDLTAWEILATAALWPCMWIGIVLFTLGQKARIGR